MSKSKTPAVEHHFTNTIVQEFLNSNLSIVLILLATLLGLAALYLTPREEDPQIVVPLADVYVNFPGHTAQEVEQLVSGPLEKILYQIDGVEYVYSMSRPDSAVITVRFFVGQDRERSLVKLFKKLDENADIIPPGVEGWVVKPVEIDDVPIVTLTLASRGADELTLRRVGEELAERLAGVNDVSRAYVVGGAPRVVRVLIDTQRMNAYNVTPADIDRSIRGTNVRVTAGDLRSGDQVARIETGPAITSSAELGAVVVGVFDTRPVLLKDVATIEDGADEPSNYVRHGWGPARGYIHEHGVPGTTIANAPHAAANAPMHAAGGAGSTGSHEGRAESPVNGASAAASDSDGMSVSAVTIAIAKKKGANAVWVADAVIARAAELAPQLVPGDAELILTRNYGLTADAKVDELVEGLGVAILIVIALLTIALGWREAMIVAVAVPVVFGLTLAVNLMMGFTINRVTLFALILALGLLVDDPIVDVENISRHFAMRKRATRQIVLEAVAEIRPPLIIATLAVIVSFLPMFFITGMMGPYMRPMALNVPVTMVMSMLVSFTITPWMAYHMLRKPYASGAVDAGAHDHDMGPEALRQTKLYRFFHPMMAPLLKGKLPGILFLLAMAGLMAITALPAATRHVPLKMLPFDNKNELLLVLDMPEGTTLERTDAVVGELERFLASVPEVTDFTSYVGVASPIDFNGLVRHYYLRQGDHYAQVSVNLAGKRNRVQQSHGMALRMRDQLTAIADRHGGVLGIVETPPGPPVLASVVAEVYAQPDQPYQAILDAAGSVATRLKAEPGVADVDSIIEAPKSARIFVVDHFKAATNGVSAEQVARTLQAAVGGVPVGVVGDPYERNPLHIRLLLPIDQRSSTDELSRLHVRGTDGALVALAEIGQWEEDRVGQTIYHKNLQRVAYVFAETVGRPPGEVVIDVLADQEPAGTLVPAVDPASAIPADTRTFLRPGGGLPWAVPQGIRVDFAGEGEWKITLDVFRDLGLAFAAALVMIYVLLVWQTRSFAIPVVVMLAIPLTIIGVMPGFWLLNALGAHDVGGYRDSVFFTATGMIGMIALAGIVTRDSIILVDFIHISLAKGRTLFDAIMESRVVRLRPILLTAGAAMLGAVPIIVDPIFSGLAWSLIFGLLASTVFTLFVIPVTYWLLYANKPGHGLPVLTEDGEPSGDPPNPGSPQTLDPEPT